MCSLSDCAATCFLKCVLDSVLASNIVDTWREACVKVVTALHRHELGLSIIAE